jgi:hypothetical protein
MYEELLTFSALLVQSGVIMVLINFLQLSNVKPTQVCSAPAGRQVILTTLGSTPKGNSAFEKADRFLEQKLTGCQFHYIAPLILSDNLGWHLLQEICYFSMKNQRSPQQF